MWVAKVAVGNIKAISSKKTRGESHIASKGAISPRLKPGDATVFEHRALISLMATTAGYQLNTFARRVSSVAGPSVWTSLLAYLLDPALVQDTFRQHLKTFMFA